MSVCGKVKLTTKKNILAEERIIKYDILRKIV